MAKCKKLNKTTETNKTLNTITTTTQNIYIIFLATLTTFENKRVGEGGNEKNPNPTMERNHEVMQIK